jgi:hypothetical protein
MTYLNLRLQGFTLCDYNHIFFYRQQVLEQERRDRELALRLASEDQSEVEDVVVPPLKR